MKLNSIILDYFLSAIISLALSPSAALAGPTSSTPSPETIVSENEKIPNWSLLVFMDSDFELRPYALWNLKKLESLLPAENLRSKASIHVEWVDESEQKIKDIEIKEEQSALLFPHSKDELLSVAPSLAIKSPIQERPLGNSPLSSAKKGELLEQFVQRHQSEHPARHYLLVIWGHGQNWAPPLQISKLKEPMDTSEFGMSEVLSSRDMAGALKGKSLDLVLMDTCSMQTLETASASHHFSNYLAGSSQIENNIGFPIFGLKRLIRQYQEPSELVTHLTEEYQQAMATDGEIASILPEAVSSFTFSVINASEAQQYLVTSFQNMAARLESYLAEDQDRRIDLRRTMDASPHYLGGVVDLKVWISKIKSFLYLEAREKGWTSASVELTRTIDEVGDGLQRSLVSYIYGSDYVQGAEYELGQFKAFGLWLPSNPSEFTSKLRAFSTSPLFSKQNQDTPWTSFLRSLFN